MRIPKLSIYIFILPMLLIGLSTDLQAQRRDHLTTAEIELVRDVQDVDLRMELFVTAIERRLWVLSGSENLDETQKKRIEKDKDKWGELPTGSRKELLSDISKILEEAINKLEDVYEREPKSELIPFAYKVIADYSAALLPQLRAEAEKTSDKMEIGFLDNAAKYCGEILEVRDSVPVPVGKRPKKKKS